jgi:hypothetical protein
VAGLVLLLLVGLLTATFLILVASWLYDIWQGRGR